MLGKTEGGRRKQAKNPKIGRSSQQTFLQGRYVDGQKAHEKMFNITNYQRNTNQNDNEVSSQTGQMRIMKMFTNNKC